MGVYCNMTLENQQLVYQSGDVVSGCIALTIDERTLLKAFGIKISGFALTQWEKPCRERKQKKNDTETDNNKPKDVYTNREDYIATTHYFVGSDAATTKVIEAGAYQYNFSVLLPENCPSVFESLFGHIRYEMDIFIVYPEYRKICYFHNLNVNRPLDLGKIDGINQAYETEILQKKSFVKFWQRPLQLQLNIPKSGFVPGENISVYVKVLNYDLLDLSDITYKLNLVTTYTGLLKKKAKMHIARSNLLTIKHSLFGKNSNVVQHLQNLVVPETSPSLGLTECRCIQISYEVEVIVSSTQRNGLITGILPLTIGTISAQNKLEAMPKDITASAPVLTASRSIKSTLEAQAQESIAFQNATAPNLETPMPMTSIGATSSFREADFMMSAKFNKKKKHIKSMEKLDDFKPKYLFYDIPIPEQPSEVIHTDHQTSSSNSISNERTIL